MTWVKLDDHFAGHPKIEAVGPLAAWLHVAALCYSSQYLTDGRIPKPKALKLTDIPKPKAHIDRLVAENLWEDDGDSYVIHDYLVYQPSREKVLAEREAAAERKRKSREKSQGQSRRDSAVTHGAGHGVSPSSPTPTRPDPSPLSTSSSSSLSPGDHDGRDPRVVEALDWYAEDDLQLRLASVSGDRVNRPADYRAKCRRERARLDGPELDAIAKEYPGLTADELRTELEDRRFLA